MDKEDDMSVDQASVESFEELGMPRILADLADGDLGDERRKEAHRHDQAERPFADPVLIAELVEHGEHDSVARREQRRQRAEHDDDGSGSHQASIAHDSFTSPVS